MIAYIYKRRRRSENGKVELQRTYRGRYRLAGDLSVTDVTLDTTDKQVAQTKLMAIIADKERERAGLTAPTSERQAVAKATLAHLQDFLADLKTLGRAKDYTRQIKSRVERLIEECDFRKLGDITSDKFVTWRSKQKGLSPKTLNEFLNAMSAFLNWMVAQERMANNPLENVAKVDLRGRQKKRRAITPDELQRLLAVATPEHRLIYLTAIYTGLRSNELRSLVWADLKLDVERPYVLTRAATTKNRKEASIPLHPELAAELRLKQKSKPASAKSVFSMIVHMDGAFRKDLAKAKIDPLDSLGRKLDFHALRKTFATRLATKGVAQRLTQELMRHQDPKLTALNYTDEQLLPTFAAVASLEWEGKVPALDAHTCTHLRTQTSGAGCLIVAKAGADFGGENSDETLANKGESHALTGAVMESQMVGAEGFEPPTTSV